MLEAEDAGPVAALITAAATGDPAAWSSIVDRFSGLVWSVARGHGLSQADAEEVYQTSWLRLAENVGRIKDPARIGAWLATTARHESLRLIRLRARIVPTGEAPNGEADDHTPEQHVLAVEQARADADRMLQVWQAFQLLSERCRQLLRALMASPPPSYVEVSAATGLAVGSIGPIRARCLGHLRESLAERGITQRVGGE
jgi:RNA polymerase sigma factor (sigma-70 family)